MHAFYLKPEQWPSAPQQTAELAGQEARHISTVLRLRPGESVVLLDGQGREAHCTLEKINKNSSILHIEEITKHPLPECRITLAAGWGKAARRGFILEKTVELEAWGLWFWQAQRSQFPVPKDIKETWESQLIAGAKQCHNPFIPQLRTLSGGVRELIQASASFDHKQVLVESEYPHQHFMAENYLALPGDTICVVGPEGGFTPQEIDELVNAGFMTLSMGDRILRWETAAVMALGLHWWKKGERK